MYESPFAATYFGDYRYNDKLDDFSPADVLRQAEASKGFLARLDAIDTSGFPEQEQLNKALLARKLRQGIEDTELKDYEMPLDQFNGAHLGLAQIPAAVPTDTTKHYEDYLARLHQIPRVIDQIIELAQLGQKDKALALLKRHFFEYERYQSVRSKEMMEAKVDAVFASLYKDPTFIALTSGADGRLPLPTMGGGSN